MRILAFFLSLATLWAAAGCVSTRLPVASTARLPTATTTPAQMARATFITALPTVLATPFPTYTASPASVTGTLYPTAMPSPSPTLSLSIGSNQQAYTMTVHIKNSSGATETVEIHYLLYLPRGYGLEPERKWPLVLFLHGSEERGDDAELLRREGLPKLLEEWPDFPAIVASPQCPRGKRWWARAHIVGAFLDRVQSMYAVDTKRIYLTGISMGAYGAWAVALRYPQRFAALVPIAGGANAVGDDVPPNICSLRELPIWVFHGRLDQNVSYIESVKAVEALQTCGGNVRFTLYEDAAHHEAWERAYLDEELYQWLFAQAKQSSP